MGLIDEIKKLIGGKEIKRILSDALNQMSTTMQYSRRYPRMIVMINRIQIIVLIKSKMKPLKSRNVYSPPSASLEILQLQKKTSLGLLTHTLSIGTQHQAMIKL